MIILLSDLVFTKTKTLNENLRQAFEGSNLRMGFIPSKTTSKKKYEERVLAHYRWLGIRDFVYFDLDEGFEPGRLGELLACDIIHLDGGNPQRFQRNLVKRDFRRVLTDFLSDGGILIGMSAGALQLGPDIGLAEVVEGREFLREDEFHGLGFVDFYVAPHWGNPRFSYTRESVEAFARKRGKVVYLCEDGGGIFVEDEIRLVGKVECVE